MDRIVHALDEIALHFRVSEAMRRMAAAPARPWRSEPTLSPVEVQQIVRAATRAVRRSTRPPRPLTGD